MNRNMYQLPEDIIHIEKSTSVVKMCSNFCRCMKHTGILYINEYHMLYQYNIHLIFLYSDYLS